MEFSEWYMFGRELRALQDFLAKTRGATREGPGIQHGTELLRRVAAKRENGDPFTFGEKSV